MSFFQIDHYVPMTEYRPLPGVLPINSVYRLTHYCLRTTSFDAASHSSLPGYLIGEHHPHFERAFVLSRAR